MNLQELLELSEKREEKPIQETPSNVITEERIQAQLPNLRYLISFFREYPDLFIDFLVQSDSTCNFHLYYYQRIFLRIVMRHRYVYATFPRGYSKSFLTMLVLMIRCILYPHAEMFVTTGGKINIIIII